MAVTATERKLLIAGEWIETGDWLDVRSPYSGELVARVAKGGAAETRRAIDAAAAVLAEPLPAHKRAEILVKVGFAIRRPIGVVGAISPFNFPCNLVAHKIAPALAAGCPEVLKPASQTPLSALLLAELETEAGLPPGWLNVVVGPSSEIGDVLVEDERVA